MLTAATLAGSAASKQPSRACAGGVTLNSGPKVRVFKKRSGGQTVVYACAAGSHHAMKLGEVDPYTPAGVDTFIVAGAMVGYHRFVCDHGGLCQMSVIVINARTRTRVRASSSAEGFLSSLVVAPNGSAAWVRASDLGADLFVTKVDSGGEQVLDEGPSIDASSLALGGDHLYWLDAGQARTAKLG